VSSQEFRVHHARAKEFSEPSADSTPQTGGNYKPAGCANQTQGHAMNIQLGNSFDPTSDFYEIGLIAATSPELAEKYAETMLRALLAAAEGFNAPSGLSDASTTQTAA
jgi:2-hydroxychromene-2-carboxylate isomerase